MRLIYDRPGEPAIYLLTDDEIEYTAAELNELLPNAAYGTIVTNAGFKSVRQKSLEGYWPAIELGTETTVLLTTSTETSINGLLGGNGSTLVEVSIDANPTASSSNPVSSGGTYTALGGKAPTDHASTATTYGVGSYTNYGHVKLSSATDSSSGTSDGVAATPAAVKAAYDLAAGPHVTVTGTDPEITGVANTIYICGEVDTLSITPPDSGIIDVVFESGSTPTVLTLPNTVVMPDWWTGVEASRIYEISIMDGTLAVVTSWAAS